jgi:hypothetical protein
MLHSMLIGRCNTVSKIDYSAVTERPGCPSLRALALGCKNYPFAGIRFRRQGKSPTRAKAVPHELRTNH